MSINSSEEDEDFVDAEDDEANLVEGDKSNTANFKNGDDNSNEIPEIEVDEMLDFPLHRAIIERKSVEILRCLLLTTSQNHREKKKMKTKKKNNGENDDNCSDSELINNIVVEVIGKKDRHGNTPLHLAVMLGQREMIELLLSCNAPIKSRNLQGWTPLDEAISYGDRKTIKSILRMGRRQARQTMDTRRPKLIKALKLIKDFQMELRWEFYSWVPLVKRFLPSDTCRIAKKGSSIRLDTTLVDFSDRSWQRGNITFLFNGEKKPGQALAIMDNELKVYQNVRYNESSDIDEDVDILMSSDIIYPQMRTKSIAFTRAQAGWFFSRYNKTEKVGQFEADFYNINGLAIESKKRREHLSEEDVQSNKAILETFKRSLESSNKQQQQSNDKKEGSDLDSIRFVEEYQDPSLFEQNQNGTLKSISSAGTETELSLFETTNNVNNGGSLENSEAASKRGSSSGGGGRRPGTAADSGGSFDSIGGIPNGTQNMSIEVDEQDDDCFENCSTTNDVDVQEDQQDTLALVSGKRNGGGSGKSNGASAAAAALCIKRRKSLQPPTTATVTWEEYVKASPGHPPSLGRPIKSKESVRNFKATLAMSKEFPLSIESLLNVLEVIAPFKHFKKLREFIKLNLPPGFPVKIDIPIIPTVLARVTFLNFQFTDTISDSLFDIPSDYSEDPNRFPDV